MNDYYFIIADSITGIITMISLILCFINVFFFKKLNKHYKALSLYIILCFFFDFFNNFLIYFSFSNIFLLPIFNIIELFLLLYFFSKKGLTISIITIFIPIGIGINLIEFTNYIISDNYVLNKGRLFNSLLFIVIVLAILAKNINKLKLLKIFYVILIYFSITFIQFLLLEFLMLIPDNSIFLTWILYALAGVVLYLNITYYLWKSTKVSNT